MDSTRRTILTAGVAAAAAAAVPRIFAQQTRNGGKFYERGSVRIYYEEAGSGFPLLLLPGGGLNATIGFFTGNPPFNPIEEFNPSTPVRRRHGMCDAGAQGRSEHFPVERTQGAHSARGAPDSFVPARASACVARGPGDR